MKKFLLLVFIAAATAHAGWPFFSGSPTPKVKKALPLSQDDVEALQQSRQQVRIQKKREELLKMAPSFSVILGYSYERKSPDEQEAFLDGVIREEKFDEEIRSIRTAIDAAQTMEQIGAATTRLKALKVEGAEEALRKLNSMDLESTMAMAESRLAELKRDAEAAYCLAHYKTANTPEEIAASIPHYSWFALRGIDFERTMGKTREEYDIEWKKRVAAMSPEERVKVIDNMFSVDSELANMRALKDKASAPTDQRKHQERMEMAAEEANDIARQAAMQQHFDSEDANQQAQRNAYQQSTEQFFQSMQQRNYQESIRNSIDSLGNTPHSGTIFYDNGHTATYEGN